MTPVKQANRHDPAGGVYGDCHRACVATMLDLPLAAVPHFNDGGPDGDEFKLREKAFLARHGLVPIDAVYAREAGKDGPGLILYVVGQMNPGVPFILGGTSRNGVDHSVVARDGEIVHDPSLDESGIVGPCGDGWYWVTFFGALSLDRRPRCDLCGHPTAPNSLSNGVAVCTRDGCANSD